MHQFDPPVAEHREVWELLPWFVNGRLSESNRQRVEAHLGICGRCRDELAAQRRIYQVISADVGLERMPMPGLNRLRRRIESLDAAPRVHAAADEASRTGSAALPGLRLRRGTIAASLAVMAVALGIGAASLWGRIEHRIAPAGYYTVTTPGPLPANAAVRAVFAPTVTLSELQTMLDDAHLKIVFGPTEAGVYSLALTGSPSLDWSLRRLRGHDAVRFAESVGPGSLPERAQ